MTGSTSHPVRRSVPTDTALLLRAASRWSEALQSHDRLEDAASLVARTTGASLSLLLRFTGDARRPARLCASGTLAERLAACPEVGEFSRLLLQDHLTSARAGSVWTLTELDSDATDRMSPRLARWMDRAPVRDALAIVLGRENGATDVLEMQFTQPPGRARLDFVRVFAATLADSRARRHRGLVPALLRHRQQHLTLLAKPADDLLGPSNPAGLTRAEFRVCLLLKRGLRPAAVRAELGISQASMRTHLRNIYAKTESAGQVDLIIRLLTQDRAEPLTLPAARRVH